MPSRSSRRNRLALIAVLAAALGLASFSAGAQNQANDRSVAQQWLTSAAALPSGSSSVLARPIQMVRSALSRADDARNSGDEAHAQQLENLARDWAEAGRDLGRANEAEGVAAQRQSELNEADARVARAKAMLETHAQRKARAEAEVASLAASAQAPAPSASAPQRPSRPSKPAAKAPAKKAATK